MQDTSAQIAAATVNALAPFLPFLIELGKTSAKKLGEVIAEKGGEATWKTAQDLWNKIRFHFGGDPEVKGSIAVVAAEPEDEARQTMLAEVLAARLSRNSDLAQELLDLLGGQEAVQRVLATRGGWVQDVVQQMKGGGEQTVRATGKAVIKGVQQIKD
jgi:hypothetical protein